MTSPRAIRLVLTAALVAVMVLPPTSHATFPGQNGKLVFDREFANVTRLWTVNPDGTDLAELGGCWESAGETDYQEMPTWSPDGAKVVYNCIGVLTALGADGTGEEVIGDFGTIDATMWSPSGEQVGVSYNNLWNGDVIYETDIVPAPGASGGGTFLTDQPNSWLDWSPDGRRIAYDWGTINPDGTGFTPGPQSGSDVSWAPDNSKLAFKRGDGTWEQIFTVRTDGTGLTQLTTGPGHKGFPVWSPDGTKIAFTAGQDVYTMDADGTDVFRVTNTPERELRPDWQPIPVNAYPRPKGASPTRVSLVPAYQPCTAPDRTHGPPLAFPSCGSPTQASSELTVGSQDANGQPAKSVSYLRANPLRGDPSTPADEADVRLRALITDVRLASNLSDYSGDLEARLEIQITDRDNTPHPGGPGVATVQQLTHAAPLPCTATADTTVGSTCEFDTTVEALVPGAVKEQLRSIWELGAIRVHDGAGSLFMTQGVFVP